VRFHPGFVECQSVIVERDLKKPPLSTGGNLNFTAVPMTRIFHQLILIVSAVSGSLHILGIFLRQRRGSTNISNLPG
jgi:hydrogenase-4 membrane subunit HyfE